MKTLVEDAGVRNRVDVHGGLPPSMARPIPRLRAILRRKSESSPRSTQDGVQRVEILGGGYFFDPNYIVVKVNVPVELSLTKEAGMTPHDFIIKAPEAGIDVSVSLDTKPQIVKFTPTKAGKYPFICTKKLIFTKSHKDKGMEGVLEVTE